MRMEKNTKLNPGKVTKGRESYTGVVEQERGDNTREAQGDAGTHKVIRRRVQAEQKSPGMACVISMVTFYPDEVGRG